jgi:arylsulfatase A-like enzyme
VRRRLTPIAGLFVLAAAACTSGGSEAPPRDGETGGRSARRPPPNVLVIVTDDQRYDQLVAMPRTRQMFMRDGTKFVNAVATTPQCCPSRASIFTGRYSHNTGVLENEDGDELDPDSTVQRYLRDAGYTTAIAGKYLQGMSIGVDPPNFDHWAVHGWGYYGRNFNIDGTVQTISRYTTEFLADTTIDWLREFERDDRKPWFVYVTPTAPHTPFRAQRTYADTRVPKLSNPAVREARIGDKPRFVARWQTSRRAGANIYKRQLRTLMSVDDLVGRVFRTMERLDESRRTIAVFVSDNGLLLGEHGLFGKRLPYRASVRIPLLLRWPGHVGAGRIDRRLVANIDLAPTILAAAGVAPDDRFPMDGTSLLSDGHRREILLEQYKNGRLPDWRARLTPKDQYVEYFDRVSGRRLYAEYYDLRRDPWQLENLIESRARTPAMRVAARRLDGMQDCVGEACP